jgi:hypothetical protein
MTTEAARERVQASSIKSRTNAEPTYQKLTWGWFDDVPRTATGVRVIRMEPRAPRLRRPTRDGVDAPIGPPITAHMSGYGIITASAPMNRTNATGTDSSRYAIAHAFCQQREQEECGTPDHERKHGRDLNGPEPKASLLHLHATSEAAWPAAHHPRCPFARTYRHIWAPVSRTYCRIWAVGVGEIPDGSGPGRVIR